MSKKRAVLATKRKIVLWILGIILLWEIFQSNAVLESLLTFGFAGVVPGTNVVLSPNMVILVSAIFLALICLVLVLRVLLKRPKDRISPQASLEALALQPVPVQSAATTPHTIAHNQRIAAKAPRQMPRFVRNSQAFGAVVLAKIVESIRKASSTLNAKMPIVVRYARRVGQFLWALSLMVFVLIRTIVITVFKKAQQYVRIFWKWVVPYLWKFDTWLELQVRAFTKWARQKSYEYHSLVVIISVYRQYKKRFSDSPITSLSASLRRSFSRERE